MKLITAKDLATPVDRWLGRDSGVSFDWVPEIKDIIHPSELSVGTGIIMPIQRIPIASGEETSWVIAALSPRYDGRVVIGTSGDWIKGQPLWMRPSSSFDPIHRSTMHQITQLRNDVSITGPDDKAEYQELPWWQSHLNGVKMIHPMEVTPPAGSGVLAIVLHRKDTGGRTEALRWHQEGTAILSNLERKLLHLAISEGGDAAVHIDKDAQGRYNLYMALGDVSGTWHKHALVHDGWKGLEREGGIFIGKNLK